ncbi:hypothetical protein CWI38_1151p0010 [Hamiltosporidium tvaerminnensis]|uniref:Uncharacterized protein n=1 Tax=Hamiltosporidium tvaerminnensis TaxID=1176355 RepID=A0A4Q9LC81_9MICR|nr:hypothetical protein LUQ84_001102 [Hamiltosporidium tvaerminnensis]TBU04681.1 hypothetical protein CWI37_0101p0030 [Hamiltosporidium tvaerminnensis]TBU11537.1 hypothetical protein CWI38_1151p0010 [Hamiltosporidium tvaerminnensis]
MYKKIENFDYNIEQHINSKLPPSETLNNFNTTFFLNSDFIKNEKQNEKRGIVNLNYDGLTYDQFTEINVLHTEYIKEMKVNLSPTLFLPVLYKAELTGAFLKFKKENKRCEGIVIEERENVFVMIDILNKIKKYPKSINNFVFTHDNVDYYLFGNRLKKNRFFKK